MVIVLTGKNTYALQAELRSITEQHTAQFGSNSIERFDGSEMLATDALLDAVRSISFLEPNKLVIVRDFFQNKDIVQKIEQIVEQVAGSTRLLLIDQKLDKRSAAYKYLKKQVDVREHTELPPHEIEKWAISVAKDVGATLSAADARMLVDRVGSNQHRIANELKKMAVATDAITRETIGTHTEQTPQSKVFDMLDALFQGRSEAAWKLYQDQRMQGEEPQKILAMITWQLQQLTLAVFAPVQSKSALVEAGMSPYGAQKSLAMAKHISRGKLTGYITELAKIDAQSKTSADIESALAVYFSEVITS